jgi:hypothetical protein
MWTAINYNNEYFKIINELNEEICSFTDENEYNEFYNNNLEKFLFNEQETIT